MLKTCFSGGIAALMLLSGCALWQAEPAGVRRYVEPDAAYLQVEEFRSPVLRLREWADAVKTEILNSKLPDRRKREVCVLLAAVQLMLRQAGLTENTAWACSGAPATIRGKDFWKTRRTLYFGTEAEKVLLYRAAGAEKLNILQELAECPADAVLAAGIELNTAEIAATGKALDLLAGPIPPELLKLMKALSGRWVLQIIPTADGWAYRLSVPDRGGAVRKSLAPLLPAAREGSIRLPGGNGIPALNLAPGKDRLTVSCGTVRKDAGSKLADLPEIQAFLRHLPETGCGYMVVTPRFGKELLQQSGIKVPFPEMPYIFGVLTRCPDALQWQTLSSWDPVSESWLVPAMLFQTRFLLAAVKTGGQLREKAVEQTVWAGCGDHLQKLGSALQVYARSHQGKFPAESGLEGFRELLKEKLIEPAVLVCPGAGGDVPAADAEKFDYENCSYVYIGGSDALTPKDFPLVLDWPLNHRNRFRVLFVSGKIMEFNMEQLDSCRKAVSFLQSRYRYPEKHFRRMLEIADKLDAKFLKGHSK